MGELLGAAKKECFKETYHSDKAFYLHLQMPVVLDRSTQQVFLMVN
jgi:hypothetical protein